MEQEQTPNTHIPERQDQTAVDEITLSPGIQAKVRQLLDQVQFLEGKISGIVEHACMPYPGQWQLNEVGTKLVRMK